MGGGGGSSAAFSSSLNTPKFSPPPLPQTRPQQVPTVGQALGGIMKSPVSQVAPALKQMFGGGQAPLPLQRPQTPMPPSRPSTPMPPSRPNPYGALVPPERPPNPTPPQRPGASGPYPTVGPTGLQGYGQSPQGHGAWEAARGGLQQDMGKYRDAIAAIESRGSGDYNAVNKTSGAVGRYQVMPQYVPQWTKEALGKPMTTDQFKASPSAQDAVFDKRFGGYLSKTGNPNDAASMWRTGQPLASGGTAGAGYAKRFGENLKQGGDATPPNRPDGQRSAEAMPRHGETVDQYQYRQLQEQPGGIRPGKPPDSTPSSPREYADGGRFQNISGSSSDFGGQSSQSVISGQTDPHKPGFDPGSVPFRRTPEMNQPQAAPAARSNPSPRAPRGTITPENHPGEYGGAMVIGGDQFSFVTGGRGSGSSPPGDHLITGFRTDGIFARKGGAFRVADVYDPAVGRTRSAVEIHQADHGVTAGCFGIPSAQWPQAKRAIQGVMDANGGKAILRVDGNGNATIVAPGTPQGDIKVSGGGATQPGTNGLDKAIESTKKQIGELDEKEKSPSLAKRIGKAAKAAGKSLQEGGKGGPKPREPDAPQGGDEALGALGQQVAAGGQAAQQGLAQSGAQEQERASHLLDAPKIQSAEQLAGLKPGQVFRDPSGKLRYYTPEAQRPQQGQG